MSNFQDIQDADRRLVILRLLSASDGYAANEYLLATALPGFGHRPSRDRLRSDLVWLEEAGLVTVEQHGSVYVATLTARGDDVAYGRAHVPGVKRPAPGE